MQRVRHDWTTEQQQKANIVGENININSRGRNWKVGNVSKIVLNILKNCISFPAVWSDYCCCSIMSLWNPMDCSMLDFPVLHCVLEFVQTHVHWISDAMQPSHPVLSLLLLISIFPSIRVFSNESNLHFG